METITLRSPLLPPPPRPDSIKPRHRKSANYDHQNKKSVRVFAGKRDAYNRDYNGRLVDENMIVLRKRIHETKMIERNYEPPSDWMEWEKRYYVKYDSDICEAMRLLQTQLMNTRPSLALGMMAMVTLSVPLSTAVTLSHLFEITKCFLSGLHLN
ncbi:PREDICTED: uncharacterized protein LOC104596483 [Nelumbo nucifera]|uniref:Uncharacterized protein LOC104596483 n=2 Tax=Nelumbo nucifera TaxID=4432 RepID=A0A1U8A2U1_NELNU|nr:PREDICTED: uncharacterized protein LOC104596483 [Nelumbo nucifera]DAD35519.1 TPA_asm: hypothetical protein HUJ06_006159 [Nelumbo nucifera]